MKTKFILLVLITVFIACQDRSDITEVNDSKLVLGDYDYFEESIPFNSTSYSREENHDEITALGRLLFYDVRLSKNNSIACASCHKQHLGFSDNEQFSRGLENYKTTRNAMSLVNNAYQVSHFWQGSEGSIDDHVLNPISNHIEMGMRDVDELVTKLLEIEKYNDLFNQVYGEAISEELITSSLSSFVASIISYNSKFDKGVISDFANFTIAEQEGMDLFFGKANCSSCHRGSHYSARWRFNTNIGLDKEYEDQGSGDGHFKIPSLRNIALTGPYMHDGRFQTLEEVVNHYVNGIQDHPKLDWILTEPISLTEMEQTQLIEFLHTLTDFDLMLDEKFSNPF